MTDAGSPNRYAAIIETIFKAGFEPGSMALEFERSDIAVFAQKLGLELPKNLGDLIYTFRYRSPLPPSVLATAPSGQTWIIRSAGRSKYRFALVDDRRLAPNPHLAVTRVPDATPGMIAKYAFNDEQALLARVRYNRLIDIFPCHCLLLPAKPPPNHRQGNCSGRDRRGLRWLGSTRRALRRSGAGQGRQRRAQPSPDVHRHRAVGSQVPQLMCRPVGAQFIRDELIALFEFAREDDGIRIISEKHYQLAAPEAVSDQDLALYQRRTGAEP